jgi:tRNA1(Val) A37 N6-methylase TrmN6
MLSVKDPRLELLSEYFSKQDINIFRDKRILDIGCHNGQMALQIGALYDPKLIIGIDIDNKLVRQATDNIHKIVNDESTSTFLKTHLQQSLQSNGVANESMLNEEEEKREKEVQSLV